MRCIKCPGRFVTKKGDLNLRDKILGDFIVSNTEWDECNRCGKILYTPATMRAIEEAETQVKKDLLLNRPLKDFILGSEVAEILKRTRQAVHKHRRIRRGFIHFVEYNKKIHYLKESVELYKKTGDGRIQLRAPNREDANGVINFKEYLMKKSGEIKTGDSIDAGSDSLRPVGAEEPQENISTESMGG